MHAHQLTYKLTLMCHCMYMYSVLRMYLWLAHLLCRWHQDQAHHPRGTS